MNEDRFRVRRFLAHGKAALVCVTKMAHPSRKVAQGFARRFDANAYRCSACGKWHVATPFRSQGPGGHPAGPRRAHGRGE